MSKKTLKVNEEYQQTREMVCLDEYSDDESKKLPLFSTLDDFSKAVSKLKRKYGKDATLEIRADSWGCGDDCNIDMTITYNRLETDKERKARMKREQDAINQEKKRQGTQKQRELKQIRSMMEKHGIKNIDDIKV